MSGMVRARPLCGEVSSLTALLWLVYPEDSRNSTWSAITAVVAANIVLASYIAISVLEDQGDQSIKTPPSKESESRKTR